MQFSLTFLPFSDGADWGAVPAGILSSAGCSSTGCSGSSMTGAQPLRTPPTAVILRLQLSLVSAQSMQQDTTEEQRSMVGPALWHEDGGARLDSSLRASAECAGSFMKSLLSMALQKASHSRTKLLLAMPPGMAMSLNRSLRGSASQQTSRQAQNVLCWAAWSVQGLLSLFNPALCE